ncbi:hypothetical protein [Tunturiibacter gelidiferens]|uniref:hypothetical protein n=1 Tax=Tunturiibacter gelidiferens TaxID=3069689 RepID=UPI003D9AF200
MALVTKQNESSPASGVPLMVSATITSESKFRLALDITRLSRMAAAGILNPLLATFIHVASELTFILNSTRLLPRREKTNVAGREAVVAHG